MYSWIQPKEHIITVRNRDTGFAKQNRVWNTEVIENVLARQKDCEDVFISKYPKSRLVSTLIFDFDSEDRQEAYNDVVSIRNILKEDGLNSVIVDSTNKGYHLYIQIAPFLFKDTAIRWNNDWDKYFREFTNYILCRISSQVDVQDYLTKDPINSNAGLGGNIRLIGSIHPSTGERVRIVDGEFKEFQEPTPLQDKAQKVAWNYCEILEQNQERILEGATQVVNGNDPIESNDLRTILPQIYGESIKVYAKGYGFMKCPEHGDNHPSLLVTKEWFSCSANCGFKGNIWTLYKKGLVKFDNDGGALY